MAEVKLGRTVDRDLVAPWHNIALPRRYVVEAVKCHVRAIARWATAAHIRGG
jgi:hypothetical protein